jgi:hypothetical protein
VVEMVRHYFTACDSRRSASIHGNG